ncbi:MAG TPA: ABC transporter substrate-binding protein [Bryobacteraceae bacterium]|nr:ABC transporter substrate-binding protein [Bryobacteraceae bacterium]
MISRRGFLGSTAAILAGTAARAAALRKITISYPTRSASSWPIFIAKEGGYYQKYGLDANAVFGVHPAGVAMVLSGQAQMTNYALESAMQAMARDASLVIVGSWLNKADFALVTRKDVPSVQALKGKRIAVTQIGDPPYNYAIALLRDYGLGPRDVEWVPIGTDVNGRAAALEGGRADATLLTAPTYYKIEEAGYKSLTNLTDHDDIFAATTYLMKRSTVTGDPGLVEALLKAHAEAIKRFYDDKSFAVKAYRVYDPAVSAADVGRFYDTHFKGNLFQRVPYLLAGAIESVIQQQTDPRLIALMKTSDYHKVVDNGFVDRLVKQGFFEKLFGPGIRAEEQRKTKLAFR